MRLSAYCNEKRGKENEQKGSMKRRARFLLSKDEDLAIILFLRGKEGKEWKGLNCIGKEGKGKLAWRKHQGGQFEKKAGLPRLMLFSGRGDSWR